MRTPLADQLIAELQQARGVGSGAHVYVLLDQNHPVAETHELHSSQLKRRALQSHRETVHRPDLLHEPAACPLLLQVRVSGEHGIADEELLHETVACALARCASINGSYVCGWLLTQAEPKKLAAHLASVGVVFDPARGGKRYVPLFEPHRLALLTEPGMESALATWLGPIARWYFVDAAGQLRCAEPGTARKNFPFYLPPSYVEAMRRIGHGQLVLVALQRLGAIPLQRPETNVDAAVNEALRQGLSRAADVVAHALNTLTLGPTWAQHPAAAGAVAKAAAGDPAPLLSELLEALPDDTLSSIEQQAGLPASV